MFLRDARARVVQGLRGGGREAEDAPPTSLERVNLVVQHVVILVMFLQCNLNGGTALPHLCFHTSSLT